MDTHTHKGRRRSREKRTELKNYQETLQQELRVLTDITPWKKRSEQAGEHATEKGRSRRRCWEGSGVVAQGTLWWQRTDWEEKGWKSGQRQLPLSPLHFNQPVLLHEKMTNYFFLVVQGIISSLEPNIWNAQKNRHLILRQREDVSFPETLLWSLIHIGDKKSLFSVKGIFRATH